MTRAIVNQAMGSARVLLEHSCTMLVAIDETVTELLGVKQINPRACQVSSTTENTASARSRPGSAQSPKACPATGAGQPGSLRAYLYMLRATCAPACRNDLHDHAAGAAGAVAGRVERRPTLTFSV
jgi:hypothetical protein